jgi:hypothetical protein
MGYIGKSSYVFDGDYGGRIRASRLHTFTQNRTRFPQGCAENEAQRAL